MCPVKRTKGTGRAGFARSARFVRFACRALAARKGPSPKMSGPKLPVIKGKASSTAPHHARDQAGPDDGPHPGNKQNKAHRVGDIARNQHQDSAGGDGGTIGH